MPRLKKGLLDILRFGGERQAGGGADDSLPLLRQHDGRPRHVHIDAQIVPLMGLVPLIEIGKGVENLDP